MSDYINNTMSMGSDPFAPRYGIRDDGAVVVWPPDFCCECNYMPGEEWRLPIGTWPRRSSFVEGCRGKVFRQD